MKSPLKYIRAYRELSSLDDVSHLRASSPKSSHSVQEARRLHAKIYLHHGYISPSDIGNDLTLTKSIDPYQNHSKYFVVRDHRHSSKPVIATARQIGAHPRHSHNSFPTIKELEIYPEMKQAILALDPAKCVEISGLAKDHGMPAISTMILYRSLWHHSLRQGHHAWLMACDAQVYKRLEFLFGDALKRIGDNSYYMGSEVVPAMLEVHRSLDPLIQDAKSLNPFKRRMKRKLVLFFMTGLSIKFQVLQNRKVIPSREIVRAAQSKHL